MCDKCDCSVTKKHEFFTERKFFEFVIDLENELKLGFMVTGSAAFAVQGLLSFQEVHDVDLTIHKNSLSKEKIELLEKLTKFSPSDKMKPGYPPIPNLYALKYKGWEVNIFVVDRDRRYTIHPEYGVRISTLATIIFEKKGMGRKKDYQQLNEYAKIFLI